MQATHISPEDRFWSRVAIGGRYECWVWKGGTTSSGYGRWGSKPARQAHRVAYELTRGPIPEGLVLDHLCRNRVCVNPEHLDPVTNRVNVLRGVGTSATNARKTHCDSGHEFTPENTIDRTKGWRECRTCYTERHESDGERLAGTAPCDVCGKHVNKRNLARHRKEVHLGVPPRPRPPVPCADCGQNITARSFADHKRRHHGGIAS